MKFPRIAQEAIRNADYFVKLLDEWRQKLDTLGANSGRTLDVRINRDAPFQISTQGKAIRVVLINCVGDGNTLLQPTLGWLPGNGFVTVQVSWPQTVGAGVATIEIEEQ